MEVKDAPISGAGTYDDPDTLPPWNHHLAGRTGTAYLVGMGVGGLIGGVQGLHSALTTPALRGNPKLQFNSVLNNAGRISARVSNHFGVFTFAYSLTSGISRSFRGRSDITNDMIGFGTAGFITTIPSTLYSLAHDPLFPLGTVIFRITIAFNPFVILGDFLSSFLLTEGVVPALGVGAIMAAVSGVMVTALES